MNAKQRRTKQRRWLRAASERIVASPTLKAFWDEQARASERPQRVFEELHVVVGGYLLANDEDSLWPSEKMGIA